MITLKDLQKTYLKSIPRNFAFAINQYISAPDVQAVLSKALNYKLSDADYNWLFKSGSHTSKQYPHLYWLCAIYIHPLTIGQYVAEQVSTFNKQINL
jgi:hypothetical protein